MEGITTFDHIPSHLAMVKWVLHAFSFVRMLQGLQTITDYKGKTSHVAYTNVLLPDKLNTFFDRF